MYGHLFTVHPMNDIESFVCFFPKTCPGVPLRKHGHLRVGGGQPLWSRETRLHYTHQIWSGHTLPGIASRSKSLSFKMLQTPKYTKMSKMKTSNVRQLFMFYHVLLFFRARIHLELFCYEGLNLPNFSWMEQMDIWYETVAQTSKAWTLAIGSSRLALFGLPSTMATMFSPRYFFPRPIYFDGRLLTIFCSAVFFTSQLA